MSSAGNYDYTYAQNYPSVAWFAGRTPPLDSPCRIDHQTTAKLPHSLARSPLNFDPRGFAISALPTFFLVLNMLTYLGKSLFYLTFFGKSHAIRVKL